MEKLYVTRTSLPPFEEYCAEIRDLWDSALITNMGVKHQRLQQELEAFLEGPLTLFANGHLALKSVLRSIPSKAPPQMNRILRVSTCRYS